MATDDVSNDLRNLGFLHGIRKLVKNGQISLDTGTRIKRQNIDRVLVKLDEADKELTQIASAISSFRHACKSSRVRPDAASLIDVNELHMALDKFDAWVVSLIETQLSLIGAIRNPQTMARRLEDIKEMMADIYQVRMYGETTDMLTVKVRRTFAPTMVEVPY